MNPFIEKKAFLDRLKRLNQKPIKKNNYDENTLVKCKECGRETTKKELSNNLYVCPHCGYHYSISGKYRIKTVLDKGTFREFGGGIIGKNPLHFPEYDQKLKEQREKTGINEAVITGSGQIDGQKVIICVMDSRFIMGSMGIAVGEKITRAAEYATKKRLPLIIFCASGGARMQEGILSLFQMAKTSAAIQRHNTSNLLYITVLTHPTTGGVTASFASLGDIILAEPKALIGFAGPRVIEQTINQKLPEGFQRSEYLMEHGFVDAICQRKDMKKALSTLLKTHRRTII